MLPPFFFILERCSEKCRKTKTKVIPPGQLQQTQTIQRTNQNLTINNNNKTNQNKASTSSAGKCVRTSRDMVFVLPI